MHKTTRVCLGTPRSGFTSGLAKQQTSDIFLTAAFSGASYSTGGVALRNRFTGEIQISGVTAPTQAAYIYWAVLLSNPTKTQLKAVGRVTILG